MKLSIVILVVILAAVAVDAGFKHKKSRKWAEHAKKHGLENHSDEEQEKHFEHFDKIDQLIEKHNSQENPSFWMAHNKFSHLAPEKRNWTNTVKLIEHQQIKAGLGQPYYSTPNGVKYAVYTATPGFQFPASFDWTEQGWTPVVKDQNPCGDCWANSVSTALEFALWKKTKQNYQLSVQELTDCAFPFGNNGCHGGVEIYAFDYILKNKLSQEGDYPFVSGKNGGRETQCRAQSIPASKKAAIQSYVVAMDEASAKEVLIKYGPITVIVDGSSNDFVQYKSGIIPACRSNMGHSVLIVGYGVENGKKFWKIQNSWGKGYGNNGFVKMTADNKSCLNFQQSVTPVV